MSSSEPVVEQMAEEKERQTGCVRCGTCTAVCPVYRVTGRESVTARGKLHLLETGLADRPSSVFTDIFAQCLLCGACENSCPRGLPIRETVAGKREEFGPFYGRHRLRRNLARIALSSPRLLDGLVKAGIGLERLSLLPADSGLRIRLGLLEKEGGEPAGEKIHSVPPLPGQATLSYFPGCLAGHVQPSIRQATGVLVQRLADSRLHEPEGQACCGLAAWSSGSLEEARSLARRNIAAFAGHAGPILTSCASCTAHLAAYPGLFEDDAGWRERAEDFSSRVRDVSAFLLGQITETTFLPSGGKRVFYHEPCHLRFGGRDREAPSALLRRVPDLVLLMAEEHHCCGQGGLFHLAYPDLAGRIFSRASDNAGKMEPDLVVTGCSGCLLQWQAGMTERGGRPGVEHLASFLARHLRDAGSENA